MDFSHLADSRTLAINQASFDLATNASRHRKHRKHRKDMEGPRKDLVSISSISSISIASLSQQRCRRWQGIHLGTAHPFAVASDTVPKPPDAPGCLEPFLNFKMRRYAESWSSSSKMFQACNGNCFGWCSNNATDDASLGSAGPVLMLNLTQTHFLVSNCRDSQRSRRLENSGLLQRPLNGRNAAN